MRMRWSFLPGQKSNGLPIMFHQGTTFPRKAPLKYANPVLLEEIALRFPDLKMIIAHLGHPWEAETIVLIRKQPNVFSDISGLFYRPWQFYNSLRLAVEYGVVDKLLFGTDYPVATFEETVEGLHHVVPAFPRDAAASASRRPAGSDSVPRYSGVVGAFRYCDLTLAFQHIERRC